MTGLANRLAHGRLESRKNIEYATIFPGSAFEPAADILARRRIRLEMTHLGTKKRLLSGSVADLGKRNVLLMLHQDRDDPLLRKTALPHVHLLRDGA